MAEQGQDNPDPAAARFWLLQLVRLGGALIAIAGLLIVMGNIAAPVPLGYALLALGLVEFAWLPQVLARRWRTPKE